MNQASLETGRTTGSSISAATGCPRSPSAACRCGRRRSRHAADLRRPGADTGWAVRCRAVTARRELPEDARRRAGSV